MAYRYVSLFSGCGGTDAGFKLADLKPLFMTDGDNACVKTLTVNFAHECDVWQQDIHDLLNSGLLRTFRDSADIVVGGPPCQSYSVAGKMDPDDERGQLVYRFMDAVQQIEPAAFIMENVPGLASPRWSLVIDRLRRTARKKGYSTHLVILDASDYGVPQARKRMFLTGMPPGCKPVIPPKRPKVTVRKALQDNTDYRAQRDANARITLAGNPVLRSSPYAGMLLNGGGRVINADKPSPVLPASMGGNRTPILDFDQLDFFREPWIVKYHAHLMNGGQPWEKIPEDTRMRRLTLYEASLIQGLVPGTVCGGSKADRWRQIGNSVPPGLAWAIAKAVTDGLDAG